jgi:hypothetical protein
VIYFNVLSEHFPRETEENGKESRSEQPVSVRRFGPGSFEYEAGVLTAQPVSVNVSTF